MSNGGSADDLTEHEARWWADAMLNDLPDGARETLRDSVDGESA